VTLRTRLPEIALAGAMLFAAVVLLDAGSGTSFWLDEWNFIIDRREWTLGALLEPHNQHLSLLPTLAYKALFALVGMDSYLPYRVLGVAMQLLCAGLLFVLVRRRLGPWPALAGAVALLFLGPAWVVLLFPFQIVFTLALAAGMGALLALEKRSRAGDAIAAGLLTLSIASSGMGIAIAIGVAVEIFLGENRRRIWIVALPAALFGIWHLAYGDSRIIPDPLDALPFAADAAAAALGGLTGVGLELGRVLAVLGFVLLANGVIRGRSQSPRLWGLLATATSFWLLAGLARADLDVPEASRYLYPGGLFILLIGAEAARNVAMRTPAVLVAFALVAASVAANRDDLNEGSLFLRVVAEVVTTELGALELAEGSAPRDLLVNDLRAPGLTAGAYFALADELGTTARSPDEIARASPDLRGVADLMLLRALRPRLEPGATVARGGPAPQLILSSGDPTATRGPCIDLKPRRGQGSAELAFPPGGVVIEVGGRGSADVRLRRFRDLFPDAPIATVRGGGTKLLRRPLGSAGRPWRLAVHTTARLSVCGVAAE
jgi:hypothetical protein